MKLTPEQQEQFHLSQSEIYAKWARANPKPPIECRKLWNSEDWILLPDPAWNFYENEYRFAQTPVPPGDLTASEAKALYEQGVAIQWKDGSLDWTDATDVSKNHWPITTAYRRKPLPRLVAMQRDDFPACCWIASGDCRGIYLVRWFGFDSLSVVDHGDVRRGNEISFKELFEKGWKYASAISPNGKPLTIGELVLNDCSKEAQ